MHLENVQCQLKKKNGAKLLSELLVFKAVAFGFMGYRLNSCLNGNQDSPKQSLTLHLFTVVQDRCEMSLVFSMFSIVCTVLCNRKRLQVLKEI